MHCWSGFSVLPVREFILITFLQEVVLIETKILLVNFPDIFKEANLQEHISGFTITMIHFNLFVLSWFLLLVLHRVWFQQNEPKIIIVWNNYERAVEIVERSTLYTFSVSFHALEAVVQRCFVKKVFLEISQNWQENTCAWVSFLIKLQGSGLFLWILWNFLEHLFL